MKHRAMRMAALSAWVFLGNTMLHSQASPTSEPKVDDFFALVDTPVIVASKKPQKASESPAMVAGQAATPQAISQNLRDVSGGIAPKGTPIYVNEFAKGATILASGGHIDYQGASGKIDFNATGDPTSGIYIWWQIQKGVVQILETIPFSGN